MLNPGGILVITLLPAAIFLTINYNGGGSDVKSGQSVKIEFAPNGSISVNNLDNSSRSISINFGTPTEVPTIPPPSEEDDFEEEDDEETTTESETLPPVAMRQKSSLREVGDEEKNEIRSSRTVKKSITNFEIPSIPTCCDLRVKKSRSGGRKILSYCETSTFNGAKESGVWELPQQFLLRKDGPKIFRLEKKRPSCKSKKFVTLDMNGDKQEDFFLSNGFLKVQNEYYRTDEYCVNGFEENNKLEIHLCEADCSNAETPCVQKCCEFDEVYSLGMKGKRGGCLKLDPLLNETFWSPTFYHKLGQRLTPQENRGLRPHIIYKNPATFKAECRNKMTTVYPFGGEVLGFLNKVLKRSLISLEFQLRKDGVLMHPNKTTKGIAIKGNGKTEKYCVDGVQNYGESEIFSNLEKQSVLFACTLTDEEEERKTTKATTTTTTTTPKPVILPVLPTCCNLNPDPVTNQPLHCLPSSSSSSSEPSSSSSPLWKAAPKFMSTILPQNFLLQKTPLKCSSSYTKAFILNYSTLPGGGSPSLMPNGWLKFQSEFFRPGEFCVNGIFPNIIEVLMCKTNCSDASTPCIQKCCGPNQVYSLGADGSKKGCVSLKEGGGDEPWTPRLYKDMDTPLSKEELEGMSPHLVQKFPPTFQYKCYKNLTLVFPFKKEVVPLMSPLAKINLQFRLRRDGKVMYRHPVITDGQTGKLLESLFNNVEYCVEGIKNFGEDLSIPYKTKDENSVLFVCAMNPS